ncbi:DNA-binding protein [Pseudomonas sp. zfem002]|uniref:DNA-binding protein n=1 Tax=Pseudomonas sp. zfem002 TaxID=3078197 RepID=UPI0029295E0D|nr:DNA-binding protein [Pseudomonas sp. zfem002]MDU9393134.1 DNA-binding protein [Pseudomonas sp. zfem002]
MARGGINKAQVQRARDALLARGETPSIQAVRIELGNTGSNSTIQRYIQELSASEPRPPMVTIEDEMQVLMQSLAERLAAAAQDAVSADRARLEREKGAYIHQREVEEARHHELQKAHTLALAERQEGQAREKELNNRLQKVETEARRLLEVEQALQQQLSERSTRIASLEGQCQHARDALEHYRSHQLAQREDELNRYEEQGHKLQTELRRTQEQLMVKNEELGQVYRDLERLTAEHSLQAVEVRKLMDSQRSLQLAVQSGVEKTQALQLQLSEAREKARGYLIRHRQDRRELRTQALQFSQLHTLLVTSPVRHPIDTEQP